MKSSPHSKRQKNSPLGLEAGEWLLTLEDREPDADHPYPDPTQRQKAFFQWVTRSPEHARVFMETAETWRRLARLDSQRLIEIQQLLDNRTAEVIHLYGREDDTAASTLRKSRSSRIVWSVAAGIAVLVLASVFLINTLGPRTYSTAVGRQETRVLPDGSIVYLNTDTRVRMDFSSTRRHLELVEGEALFVVARDPTRPFTVDADGTVIEAIGTRFNVRRRPRATEVTVVEGAVQVRADEPVRLNAGETANVVGGVVRKSLDPVVDNAVSWREWRLVFRDAPLAEIADEFNRYNRNPIRVEGAEARAKLMTGVFDADRPESLIAYTSRDETLSVRTDGNGWVISAR